MRLIHDCLDKQLVDRSGRKMGRVDGIVLEVAQRRQPRVAYLEVGAVTQATRLHPRAGRWVAAIARRWGRASQDPYRIPWSRVIDVGQSVKIAASAEDAPVLAWECWLREHVLRRIAGG